MPFELTEDDEALLAEAHPDLARVVRRAAADGDVIFYVNEVARTVQAQRANIAKGVSKTMASRHIPAADGYAYAVDLIPEYNGKWETVNWEAYYPLAEAMRDAAKAENVALEWGGVWDKRTKTLVNAKAEVAAYVKRMKAKGSKSVFIDGPHFQLPARDYPGNAFDFADDDPELLAASAVVPPILKPEPKLIKEVNNELRANGSRTIKEGDKITTTGKVIAGTGAVTTVGKGTGLFDRISDMMYDGTITGPLLRYAKLGSNFVFDYWYIIIIVIGFYIWQSGFRIKFFKAQDVLKNDERQ